MARFRVKGKVPRAKMWSVVLTEAQDAEVEKMANDAGIKKTEVIRQMVDYCVENMR